MTKEDLDDLGIAPQDVLMVDVSGDRVGFGDELELYQDEGLVRAGQGDWQELSGFNAFFARAGETPAIGNRLKDCAHIEFHFEDSDGVPVAGFEHGTRPNMCVDGARLFEIGGQAVPYTEYVLWSAVSHYEADPASFRIRLSPSINWSAFVRRFDSLEEMEDCFPGWYETGFLYNGTNPGWQPGDLVTQADEWYADVRGMTLFDINQAMERLGMEPEQLEIDDMLDPADMLGEITSRKKHERFGAFRDLFLIKAASDARAV